MQEQKLYVIEQAEQYLYEKVGSYYNLKNTAVSFTIVPTIGRWLPALLLPDSKITVRLDPILIADVEVCYVSELNGAFLRLMSKVSDIVYTCLHAMLHNDDVTLLIDDMLILDKEGWRNTLVTCPLIRSFFNIDIHPHVAQGQVCVTYTEKYIGKKLMSYFNEIDGVYTLVRGLQEC